MRSLAQPSPARRPAPRGRPPAPRVRSPALPAHPSASYALPHAPAYSFANANPRSLANPLAGPMYSLAQPLRTRSPAPRTCPPAMRQLAQPSCARPPAPVPARPARQPSHPRPPALTHMPVGLTHAPHAHACSGPFARTPRPHSSILQLARPSFASSPASPMCPPARAPCARLSLYQLAQPSRKLTSPHAHVPCAHLLVPHPPARPAITRTPASLTCPPAQSPAHS